MIVCPLAWQRKLQRRHSCLSGIFGIFGVFGVFVCRRYPAPPYWPITNFVFSFKFSVFFNLIFYFLNYIKTLSVIGTWITDNVFSCFLLLTIEKLLNFSGFLWDSCESFEHKNKTIPSFITSVFFLWCFCRSSNEFRQSWDLTPYPAMQKWGYGCSIREIPRKGCQMSWMKLHIIWKDSVSQKHHRHTLSKKYPSAGDAG